MAAFEWTKERRVLRGPFDFFDKSMTLEVLEVDKTEDTTVLLRVTYNAGNDLLDLGRKHFHVPPLHLHFKVSCTLPKPENDLNKFASNPRRSKSCVVN